MKRKDYLATEDKILRSTIDLLKEEEPDHVSVLGICQHSKISRNSFYNHFSNVDEVYFKIRKKCLETSYSFFGGEETYSFDDKEHIRLGFGRILHFLKKNRDLLYIYKILNSEISEAEFIIKGMFSQELSKRLKDIWQIERAWEMFKVSGTNLLQYWIENEFIDDENRVLDEFVSMTDAFLNI